MTDHVCHPLLDMTADVVDVKRRGLTDSIGRTGVVRHDPKFDRDYFSFTDGGSADPADLVLEPFLTPDELRAVISDCAPQGEQA